MISAKLREKSGVSVELYRLHEAMQRRRVKVHGNDYDLARLIEHVLGQLATDLASEANRLWSDEWDMDAILITGGGGAALAPYITPLLSGRVLPVDASDDTRLNNVRGYYKYGLHLWGGGGRSVGADGGASEPVNVSTGDAPGDAPPAVQPAPY